MTNPVLLPAYGVRADKPRLVDYGGALKAVLGGPTLNLLRLGTRHAIDITPRVMRAEPQGRIWSSRLRQAKIYGALFAFGQDGLAIGAPGAPVVNGGGQTGSGLALRGFTPGYVVREGQAFSLVTGGRRYLYFAAADATASGAGALQLAIFPMLRAIPSDADVCEFSAPILQGLISGNEAAWDRPAGNVYNFGTITITEDA